MIKNGPIKNGPAPKFREGQVVVGEERILSTGQCFNHVFVVSDYGYDVDENTIVYDDASGRGWWEGNLQLATWDHIEEWSERIRKQASALLMQMDKVRAAFPPSARRKPVKDGRNIKKG